ncbi:unnamed protein product [Zymoseptoria tritici ST99CH_1E4]|uniref:C2H2 type master regulator of conidiophore development brlA n=1 Tax=Zymoseptoria tritici ST99CH_1E4 TaxID=1276532 RepID=A0A2H1H5J1_ZYMTR|nr:unnamed protein product [Zymoseptoria tritici ST99CH_1E4]
MDSVNRGRSLSAQSNHLRHSTSASPHPDPVSPFSNNDNSFAGLNQHATNGAFGDATFTQDFSQQAQYSTQPAFTGNTFESQSNNLADSSFLQGQQTFQNVSSNQIDNSFPSFDLNQNNFNQPASLDPTLLDFNTNTLDLLQTQNLNQNHNNNLDPMAATMQSHSSTPPHLFANGRRTSGTPSPAGSPGFQQANMNFGNGMNGNGMNGNGMNRPRNASESLDPSSALFPPQGQNEWVGMGGYRSHKRTPSDNLSDISSNHASPYMGTLDNFDIAGSHSSPMLSAHQDPTFNDGLGLQQFSLNDNSQFSPGHSPGPSPHIMPQPQHALPAFTAENNFGLSQNLSVFNNSQQQQNGLEMFPGLGQDPFPSMNTQGSSPADPNFDGHMSPPEINIVHAPPTKVEDIVGAHRSQDALSPPLRTTNRQRAKSDSHAGARSPSPALSSVRGRSPSLQHSNTENLSPFDNTSARSSRSASPASPRGRPAQPNRARSASNASDTNDRGYILDLADPARTPSTGGEGSKRQQKHPATFQCTLCPKRFTRAYNLRSHLRTHTDERPFVCTVCGKAFARQHDRKRHEGLHSGEKKFVCRGVLQGGSSWGCGRRFARADALGRHFRSEAGRVCIKPLLDEEAADRQKAWMEEQQQAQMAAGLMPPQGGQQPMLAPQQDFMLGGGGAGGGGANFLPAALLAQYPALAGIDWNSIPTGPPPMEEDEISGRSSFDAGASSGGEGLYDELSEGEVNMGGMNGLNHGGGGGMGGQQGQGVGYFGNQAGDYLSDFEGR